MEQLRQTNSRATIKLRDEILPCRAFALGQSTRHLVRRRPFLANTEVRVPQVRRLSLCISGVRTTHKLLALSQGLGYPSPLIFACAICATHAHSPSARIIGFCIIWVCINSTSSSSSSSKPPRSPLSAWAGITKNRRNAVFS